MIQCDKSYLMIICVREQLIDSKDQERYLIFFWSKSKKKLDTFGFLGKEITFASLS
jgi:hypothetical protein